MAKQVSDPIKLPKGYVPKRNDNDAYTGIYYATNIDNPEAYKFDDIFKSPGQVAAIYDNIRNYGGENWRELQARFLENADKYSNYLHGMRQANLKEASTNPENPGIIGIRTFPTPGKALPRTSKEAQEYLKSLEMGSSTTVTSTQSGTPPQAKYHLYRPTAMGAEKYPVTKEEYARELAKQRNSNELASYADGGPVDPKLDISALGQAGGEYLANILASLINQGGTGLQKELDDYRTNPGATLEKMDKRAVATDIAGSTAKAAGTGFGVAGPVGAAVGAGVGLIGSGVKALLGKDDRQEARDEATADWSSFWTNRSSAAFKEAGYKSGGEIKGKGSEKSDDVEMNAPEGAFIVPSENASTAMKFGKEYLGWGDKEVASRNYGNVDINVSNGEVFFTPEEYDQLSYYGVDVDALAPNAEESGTGFCRGGKTKMAKGGSVPSPEKAREMLANPPHGKALTEKQKRYFQAIAHGWKPDNYAKGGDVTSEDGSFESYIKNVESDLQENVNSEVFGNVSKVPLPEKESLLNQFMKHVGEVAGVAQAAGGVAGLIKAGKRPDINVSKTLQRLSRDVHEAAGYGLPPAVKNAMKNEQERAYIAAVNKITGQGGSGQDVQQKILSALSTKLSAANQTEIADYQAKEAKIDRAISVDQNLAQQEFDVMRLGLNSWEKDQDVWAELLQAGIANIVGANQYNKELQWNKENLNRNINFTLPR